MAPESLGPQGHTQGIPFTEPRSMTYATHESRETRQEIHPDGEAASHEPTAYLARRYPTLTGPSGPFLMPCYFPSPVRRDTQPNANGNYEVIFCWKGSQLDYDFELPCGKCDGCRKDQAREWGVRMYHESLLHDRCSMITLTYSPEALPEDGKLDKSHVQEFIQKLRDQSRTKIRYYCAGEYGGETGRAHYHAVIFGEDFLGGAYKYNDDGVFGNVILDRLWGHGNTTIVPADGAALMYAAGYVNKKAYDPDTFTLQSRGSINRAKVNPSEFGPIAYRWAEKHAHTLNDRGDVVIDGTCHPIPSRYFEWFPEQLEIANEKREEHARCNRRSIEQLRSLQKNRQAKAALKETKI